MNQPTKTSCSTASMHGAFAVAITALALAGLLLLSACSTNPTNERSSSMSGSPEATNTSNAYRKISATEGQTLMDAGNVVVVDVRTPEEYTQAHIPGAINIPVENIGSEKPAELSSTDANLIVYCRTGVRSKQASDKLIALGYQHVNDMGGIVDWTGDTVSGAQPNGA